GILIENAQLYTRATVRANTDGLTGLYNHRHFHKSLEQEIARCSRHNSVLSLIMLDIDHFKDYNDKYEHASGDLILKFIAKTISDQLEGPDVASRYGGEELALLLWKKSKKEARLKADKIRQLVKKRPLTLRKHEANVTVSIGVSTFPEDGATEEELIRAADLRLYRAKAAGRDRVCSD
ncbi:MAG: GGDEF domain-containing protein, partial [Candidatus Omnitrophica bacterium]|nr:GGDEF domain-containing protein [Candidatus Omnitrophota bacterium]